jgi:hypothetical protein
MTQPQKVIRVRLSAEQTKQITPLVHKAAAQRENVIFFAVACPFWSPNEGAVIWELQVSRIRAKCGQRVRKAILDSMA